MKHNQQGLSLVELMIAITLGIVLMTGVVQTFLSSKTVFSTQKGVSRVQETGRLGMEFLARDIREAGYMGCLSRTGINYTSTLNDPDDYEIDFEVGIEASSAAPVSLEHTPISPVLTLRSAAGGGVGIAKNNNSGNLVAINTGATGNGCFSGLCPDDILIITDCSKARVFQATNLKTNSHGVLVVHAASGTPGNKPPASWGGNNADDTFDKGSEIIKIRTRMYYVADADPSDDNVRPGLFMKEGFNPSVELLKNVENMHLEFGVDTNFDGRVDNFVALEQVATVASWADVAAVKVELLVGSSEDNVSPDPRQYEFAGKTVTSADNRIRQVFTSTVGIRSRLN
ncbi:PilW family protein [Gilvimarinus xylanilyticus]|uniref:PilW family protein n=1 Tax=Gilvimarinus xylanilyticus TaxID=2944139 RepID=A0A9X2I5J5_9GAMM|nr:PilW family protein [Gilvimarinus xylanilyticus]MCP8900321.1 PilW family protein [Gilvimarinus xylanilyticus]